MRRWLCVVALCLVVVVGATAINQRHTVDESLTEENGWAWLNRLLGAQGRKISKMPAAVQQHKMRQLTRRSTRLLNCRNRMNNPSGKRFCIPKCLAPIIAKFPTLQELQKYIPSCKGEVPCRPAFVRKHHLPHGLQFHRCQSRCHGRGRKAKAVCKPPGLSGTKFGPAFDGLKSCPKCVTPCFTPRLRKHMKLPSMLRFKRCERHCGSAQKYALCIPRHFRFFKLPFTLRQVKYCPKCTMLCLPVGSQIRGLPPGIKPRTCPQSKRACPKKKRRKRKCRPASWRFLKSTLVRSLPPCKPCDKPCFSAKLKNAIQRQLPWLGASRFPTCMSSRQLMEKEKKNEAAADQANKINKEKLAKADAAQAAAASKNGNKTKKPKHLAPYYDGVVVKTIYNPSPVISPQGHIASNDVADMRSGYAKNDRIGQHIDRVDKSLNDARKKVRDLKQGKKVVLSGGELKKTEKKLTTEADTILKDLGLADIPADDDKEEAKKANANSTSTKSNERDEKGSKDEPTPVTQERNTEKALEDTTKTTDKSKLPNPPTKEQAKVMDAQEKAATIVQKAKEEAGAAATGVIPHSGGPTKANPIVFVPEEGTVLDSTIHDQPQVLSYTRSLGAALLEPKGY